MTESELDAFGALKIYPVRSIIFVVSTPIFIYFILIALAGSDYVGFVELGPIFHPLLAMSSCLLSVGSLFSLYGKVK